ncbi:MAG: hypothetical protein J1F38_00670 [Muribaculaceae bacterium]|nr:hypothetical protein [Muribaculaceae bacterium]
MQGNNKHYKIFLINELVYGTGYDSHSHKFNFNLHHSISPEKLNSLILKGQDFGIPATEAESYIDQILNSLPVHPHQETPFTVDVAKENPGEIFEIEFQENGNIATLSLMTIGGNKLLVLDSSDSGLLPGDFIRLTNTRISSKGNIQCEVEAPECKNLFYFSMPVSRIVKVVIPLAYEALSLYKREISSLPEDTGEYIDLNNPVMGILFGKYSLKAPIYMNIDPQNSDQARLTNGEVIHTSQKKGFWQKNDKIAD